MKKFLCILISFILLTAMTACSTDTVDDIAVDSSAVVSDSESIPEETQVSEETQASEDVQEAAPVYDWGITVPEDLELGGVLWDNGYLYLDESDPLICLGEITKEVTLSDSTVGTSSIRLPYINLDTVAARETSDHIYNDYSAKYAEYFNAPDDRIVNVDYSYEIAQDTLVILIRERVQSPESVSDMTYVFYYDILVDCEIGMSEFISNCATTFAEILEGLHETQWAADYLEAVGGLPDDSSITAITFNIANEEEGIPDTFDLYCINPDSLTQTVVTVAPVETEIDFSALENYTF